MKPYAQTRGKWVVTQECSLCGLAPCICHLKYVGVLEAENLKLRQALKRIAEHKDDKGFIGHMLGTIAYEAINNE